MASWMVHLRVADILFDEFNDLRPREYYIGTIAPDCGVPNEDYSSFSPSKKISHFQVEGHVREESLEWFADKYLRGRSHTREQLSFYLGYYIHLAVDILWSAWVRKPILQKYQKEFEIDKDFIWEIKKDWYDLDHRYLREHPDFRAYREFEKASEFENVYMNEFASDAFKNRQKDIVTFYNSIHSDLDREYPYLTEEEMNQFVHKAAQIIGSEKYAGQFCVSKQYISQLPEEILKNVKGEVFHEENIGCSNSRILLFANNLVLKVEPYSRSSDWEHRAMTWCDGKINVPKVVSSIVRDNISYLLMTKVEGLMACDTYWLNQPEQLVHKLADTLKTLWSIPIPDCPFDMSLKYKLGLVREEVEQNDVDMNHCEEDTFGPDGFSSPEKLYEYLENNCPEEDLVLTHGDFCLPNIFFKENGEIGLIDIGNLGVADRYQDIALCLRSLKYNLSCVGIIEEFPKYRQQLFEELHMTADENKIRYYALVDELF